ncbi:MAG TPA: hypothetical protein VFB41_06575 [Solirubrobacteraceae bacterium]|nr:hypothetical protein [Solirubrobacteraceae bacterium]
MPNRRTDLEVMYRQGEWLAEDALVDLVSDAVRYHAAMLRDDGSIRDHADGLAFDDDLDGRIGAALRGCGDAFALAAERYRSLG